jgi:hypothetical protein
VLNEVTEVPLRDNGTVGRALGARRADILNHILRKGVVLASVGMVPGVFCINHSIACSVTNGEKRENFEFLNELRTVEQMTKN